MISRQILIEELDVIGEAVVQAAEKSSWRRPVTVSVLVGRNYYGISRWVMSYTVFRCKH